MSLKAHQIIFNIIHIEAKLKVIQDQNQLLSGTEFERHNNLQKMKLTKSLEGMMGDIQQTLG